MHLRATDILRCGASVRLRLVWGSEPWAGEAVPEIRVPTLVIGGRDDFIMVGVERLIDVIPGAQMAWTSGDHFTALDDPAFATTLVQFFTAAAPVQ